jgi:hypothetical protein
MIASGVCPQAEQIPHYEQREQGGSLVVLCAPVGIQPPKFSIIHIDSAAQQAALKGCNRRVRFMTRFQVHEPVRTKVLQIFIQASPSSLFRVCFSSHWINNQ